MGANASGKTSLGRIMTAKWEAFYHSDRLPFIEDLSSNFRSGILPPQWDYLGL
jgi:hypothetical protein